MATSIIKVHILSGASDGGPPCYILQVDEFHCLLDCGWPENLQCSYVQKVSQWARHIDAVLLSHQSLRHIGLLPYLVGSCGLHCPVYATTPVYKMGQLTLYDFYQSIYASQDFSAFSLDDVDAAFDLVTQVKYQQTVNLSGRGRGLCITPLPSGHTLGGTLWKLVKEDTDIVYAVDFNHKKERHLNGATFDACMRPHLLILDASNTLYTHPRRKDRDENLRQCILKSLRRGGNVLVAVDTSGRCLEVAHFLEQCWLNQDSGMMAYGLAMLSFVAFNVVDFAKSMVEWMSEKVMRTFEDQRSNPFHFRHLQLCHSLEQLDAVPEPKVVLASLSDLSCGYSRQLFAEWADNDLNTVIFTSREASATVVDKSSLITSLIGLATGDSEARVGLPTSSTGTIVLPLTLAQRVSSSQLEQLESEMPRIRNAVQTTSTQPSDSTVKPSELDISIPMPETDPDASDSGAMDQDSSYLSNPNETGATKLNDASFTSNVPSEVVIAPIDVSASAETTTTITTTTPTPTTPTQLIEPASTPTESLRMGSLHTRPSLAALNRSSALQPAVQPDVNPFATPQLAAGRHQAGYDIYPGLHNHAGGQFFRMAKRTQLLFPLSDKTVHWDEYGALLDRDMFLEVEKLTPMEGKIKGSKGQQSVASIAPVLAKIVPPSILESLVSKISATDDPSAKTHVITHQLEIPLRCELLFMDYEGRSDGEAMKRIVLGLRPQEVILVGSNRNAVEHLAGYCRSVMQLRPELIHCPNSGDLVNCTKEGDIYQARMKDSLVSNLKFTKIRDYELAWVDATISLDGELGAANDSDGLPDKNARNATTDDVDMSDGQICERTDSVAANQLPVLHLPTGPVGTHETVFVNEPKLSDLKQLLLAQGLMAEFVSGVLVVDNCVAIKRSEAGKLLLEGVLSRTYFNHSYDQVVEDIELLISKIRSRESAVNEMCQQVAYVQALLRSMRHYQEEVLTINDLSDRVSNHPRAPLILGLAAENHQLEQLRVENRTLCDSLDEHQIALDLIMQKYRRQMAKFMQANQVEKILRSGTSTPSSGPPPPQPPSSDSAHPNFDPSDGHLVTAHPINGTNREPQQPYRSLLSTLAVIADDVCKGGDAYAAELETELHRLRSENAGLREILNISSACVVEPASSSTTNASSESGEHKVGGLPGPPSMRDLDQDLNKVNLTDHFTFSDPVSQARIVPTNYSSQSEDSDGATIVDSQDEMEDPGVYLSDVGGD